MTPPETQPSHRGRDVPEDRELFRKIPKVDELLGHERMVALAEISPLKIVKECIREVLDSLRQAIAAGSAGEAALELDAIIESVAALVQERDAPFLVPVVNGTGVIVHTNLGRSILAGEALDTLLAINRGYCNLEYDLEEGVRGSRYVHAQELLCELTGADAALVVNNNAAAVLLALSTLAAGREVVVSRGELVEIGGSFRIPDVMARSGAILREVGCTNRTHLRDYEAAIGDLTAAFMKVHTSNYRMEGFVHSVSAKEMADLAHAHNLIALEDLGSGCLIDLRKYGLKDEPTAQEALAAGLDVVSFSGDKLLGGPQAGIILGRADLVAEMQKNPLTRALRVDKLCLAALEATLRLYRDERKAAEAIPTLRAIAAPLDELKRRATRLRNLLRRTMPEGAEVTLMDGFSRVGGGSLPEQGLATKLLALKFEGLSAAALEGRFRANSPPIIGRIERDVFLLDIRTILDDDFKVIARCFAAIG